MSVYEEKIIPDKLKNYCQPPHWDANAIFRHTVPDGTSIPLPMTPRPYAKICLEYKTSAPFLPAPPVPERMVFTGASELYPPTRYIKNIDTESAMERLDRPLNRDPVPSDCPGVPFYLPSERGDMFTQRWLLNPPRPPVDSTMSELQLPGAIRDIREYGCRQSELACDVGANSKLWFNATKLQKFNQKDADCGARYDYRNGRAPSAGNLPKVWDNED